MSKVGAELGTMAALKKTLDTNAQRATELRTQVKGSLGNTVWEGPAATRFRESWANDFEPALLKLTEALAAASAEVERRRAALERAGA